MPKKVLIVEDEIPLLKILESKIKKLGFKVTTCTSGNEVLPKIKKEKPDLLLLDIVLPGESGFEVLEELKIKEKNPIPVIILSNLEQEKDIKMGKKFGVKDYIIKSQISLRDLMLKINAYLV